MAALKTAALAIICAGALTACSSEDQDLETTRRTENELMHDIARAGPAIEDRLRNRVELNGSIILLSEKRGSFFWSLAAMPAQAQWSVKCGPQGISLDFGSTGEFGSGVNVQLSGARLDENACKVLVPLTASKVEAILSGN